MSAASANLPALPAGSLGAVTCLSVVEHGVPIEAFLRESARILRPWARAVKIHPSPNATARPRSSNGHMSKQPPYFVAVF